MHNKFLAYKKDKANGKCIMKYYKYGFIDLHFDLCTCPKCERYSDACDVVENKKNTVSAKSALKKEGFTKYETREYINIFIELGIFDRNELAGIPEISFN